MKCMSLKEITDACKGTYCGDPSLLSLEVAGVAIDSRKIGKDWLFIPIKGARVDGHSFISQVMEQGALCTLSEYDLGEVSHPYILVDSCEQAMKDIARHYRLALDIKVVGITGSVGKTSTKEMIASVLAQKYNVLKTEGNFNNEIGLPLTIFNIRDEHQVAVLEMGINHFGEMHRLSKMAQPDVCVITNIGLCHLEYLIDRDGILRAKSEIFDFAMPDAAIVLNGDDDKLQTLTEVKGLRPSFFGLSGQPDAYADNIKSRSLRGTNCDIHLGDDIVNVLIPIPGEHMVYNALAGALVGQKLGLSIDEIKAGIESLTPVSGRNHLIETPDFLIIDDCYNANPVSMKAALDTLATAEGHTVAILGDMFELGKNEAQLHYDVGVHAAACGIHDLITIGELSEHIANGARQNNPDLRVSYFKTKDEFFHQAKQLLKSNDTILIKASHGMAFSEIVQKLEGGL